MTELSWFIKSVFIFILYAMFVIDFDNQKKPEAV